MLWANILRRHTSFLQRVPWKWVGLTIAVTPAIAVAQGAYLLYDYRMNHGNAPHPDIPSSGLVVVRSNSTQEEEDEEEDNYNESHPHHNSEYLWFASSHKFWKNQHQRDNSRSSSPLHTDECCPESGKELSTTKDNNNNNALPPLRLLVIGDSLAAGVGTSHSGTPILPESIAQALSKSLNGRAVYWDCIGVPGRSAREIVHDIHQLRQGELLRPSLVQRLAEWQAAQRSKAQDRLETAQRRTKEWLQYRREQQQQERTDSEDIPSNVASTSSSSSPNHMTQWWNRTTTQMRRDLEGLRRIFKRLEENETSKSHHQRLVRRNSIDPKLMRKYDVAVVFTGLNDLKDSWLPFMRQRQQQDQQEGNRAMYQDEENQKPRELQFELLRILDALRDKMKEILPPTPTKNTGQLSDKHTNTTDKYCGNTQSPNYITTMEEGPDERGPLVVFPGLPYEPTRLVQYPPLSWFIVPLFEMTDRNKKNIAEMFPELVLYVEPPDSCQISDAESKRGPQWEDFHVLLKLNDVAPFVKEKVEALMKQHYESWVTDHDQNDNTEYLYQLDVHGVLTLEPTRPRRGSVVVAADGIHPSDIGYDMWGRHIARAIVQTWYQRDRQADKVNHDVA